MSDYKIVRSARAGVFFAKIAEENGQDFVLVDARRIWYWDGAASLSELAVAGVRHPDKCKFPVAVEKIRVFEVIEVLEVTETAAASIRSVKIWSE